MMRVAFLTLLALLVSTNVFAHGDHAKLTDEDFIGKASFDVSVIVDNKDLVDGELLDESWKKIREDDKQIVKKTDKFVIVSLYNREKKRNLFILLTEYVEYLGANFSGKFEGI